MRRPPITLFLATILGLISAGLLIGEGLAILLFSHFRLPDALWIQWAYWLGIDPYTLAWPWLVLGISWISSLCGTWLRMPWGRWALYVVCILTLFYLQVGTILAVCGLIALALPMSQQWIKESHVPQNG